ncbi:alpha-glucan family phosphorylase [bacterium]|nr:alpha-glucan family phosphorylase [bacterium]
MYRLRNFIVIGKVPHKLRKLETLAYNLWWVWNSEGQELFNKIDPESWEFSHLNPIVFLKIVSPEALNKAAQNQEILDFYEEVISNFETYLDEKNTWFKSLNSNFHPSRPIAYFCAEFGLTEVLPIYSGGLGILAGDHVKTASDLGLPFIGIGLLYREGYFRQEINSLGEQIAKYPELDFSNLPLHLCLDKEGKELQVQVKIADRNVIARIWKVEVGRVQIYLLDTDIQLNSDFDRAITRKLYGGDQNTRISQEILLGIGGVRALNALGINPSVWHMNEGHSAFLGLERIRQFIHSRHLTFEQALEAVASSTLFTTHTPVPAGNDAFSFSLMENYFSDFVSALRISQEDFFNLGRNNDSDNFNLTILSLRLSRQHNGVSRLHGKVSQNLWKNLWKDIPLDENPIQYITNGVHTKTWLAEEMAELYSIFLGKDWEKNISDTEMWKRIYDVYDAELWEVKQNLKVKMINFIKRSLKHQYEWEGVRGTKVVESPELVLDPNVLTIGFARRFATYKRASLIFRDIDRLRKIVNNKEMPVQLIFAGKAHPADKPGQEIVKEIYRLSRTQEFEGKIIILENYNMKIARYLVSGVDVWLNNPRKPLEASGTSGQKVAINGVLNFSVLDGWWEEGYNGKNGWAIGNGKSYDDEEKQDLVDLNSIYDILERQIIPIYYERNEKGFSKNWVKIMKESIVSNAPVFSTDRMVKEYFTKFYEPAVKHFDRLASDNFLVAQHLLNWKNRIRQNWENVKIELTNESGFDGQIVKIGDSLEVTLKIDLASFSQDEVSVEFYVAGIDDDKEKLGIKVIAMDYIGEESGYSFYKGVFSPHVNGKFGYSARVVPKNDLMVHPYEMGLVKWIS